MPGRPRGVQDADLVRAAVEVVGRVGPQRVTLAAVAREAGVVPGTLVQRFGSKRGLLLAVSEQAVVGMDAALERVRAAHPGPLEALAALTTAWWAPLSTPEAYANHLAFLCVDLTDPEFYERALAVHRAQREAVAGLLAEAVAAGVLRPDTDVPELAATVLAMTSGTGLVWALDREGDLARRLERSVDTALRPHLAPATAKEET